MSFNINSDKERIRGVAPQLIGDNELSIRGGTGSSEREILRTLLDETTGLPRVGINRTGQRVNSITITAGGSGYTIAPAVSIAPPTTPGGVRALATAFIFNGRVVNVAINEPGSGYTQAPVITFTSDNGFGAAAESALDTVDFELDINGAIRTSTSIISDTARVLNLDIDNFVTPDLVLRGPNLKTFVNNTGTIWDSNVILQKNTYRYFGANVYQALNTGQTGSEAPTHTDGIELNGEVQFKHIGFRVEDENAFGYNQTGSAGVYPRSITPLLGDRSDKIATTEYVLNLATNDVGGRIYVSQQIGNDENDGRSAVNPVRTIKKACQLAWTTPGVKETIIVSGGDYVEDNPISIPPDASIVGDNLRLVIIRPANPNKHIMKFGDKNYIIGVTYRDQVDSVGDAVATWDFAMVFDDKQRILVDSQANGDFGTFFPVGHQIFGPDQFRVDFQENTGGANLQAGLEVVGLNTGSRATIIDVNFDTTFGADAYLTGTLDVTLTSGSFLEGESYRYIITGTKGNPITLTITQTAGKNIFRTTDDPDAIIPPGTYIHLDDTNDANFTEGFYEVAGINDDESPAYWDITVVPILGAPEWDSEVAVSIDISEATIVQNQIDTTALKSIRAEGEVVSVDDNYSSSLPIQRIDFTLQGDPSIATGGFQEAQFGSAEDLGGIVLYTNELVGRTNIHDFREGQEVFIQGLPTFPIDCSALNGYQRIYKILEDADGRSRRFVIPKKFPAYAVDPGDESYSHFDPGQNATVRSYTKSVTLTLLNSPNTFPLATPVERRFQDAVTFIRNNRDFIADEVVGKINDQFKKEYFAVYNIGGTPAQQFTPTDATYDPATGEAVFTVANHGLQIGDGIRIQDESIIFTCAMDGNKTEHATPESHHYASNRTLNVDAVTTNTFTVNVGASGANQEFTPSAASYDPSTGNITLNIGSHTLSVGEGIVFADNSISFTCTMDGNDSVKTYPRPGIDPYAGKSTKITAVTETEITVNIGASKENEYFTPTDATYNPSTGDLTVTVGQHGLGVGRSVVLNDNSFTFTCAKDGNATEHTYPRPGIDPYAGKSIEITAVGSNSHTVESASYNPSTGVATIGITSHGFTQNDYILLEDNSITFTCDLDGNATQHTYPRSYDYASGRWLKISNVTSNTFDVNVGASTDLSTHSFVSATTNGLKRQDGTFTINVGTSSDTSVHTFVPGDENINAIKHEPRAAHTFAGATTGAVKHLPQSAHTFKRSIANAIQVGGSTFDIYLGPSRFEHTYITGGTVTYNGVDYTVNDFNYDTAVTGVATVSTVNPIATISEDQIVKIAGLEVECSNGTKVYPSFNIPVSDEQCKQDIVHFLNALCRDLEFGTNHNVIEAGQKYVVGAKIDYVENEIIQTVRAMEYARTLATYAMRNWRTKYGTPSDPVYVPEYSSVPRYFDPTIITSTALLNADGTVNNSGYACNDVRAAIDTLTYLFIDVVANNTNGTYLDAAYLIARNRDVIADQAFLDTQSLYPSLNLSDLNERKCRRDINFILGGLIRDLALGGNSGIVTNAEAYYTGLQLTGIEADKLEETRYAYERVELYAKAAMRNWSGGNSIAVTPSFATYDSSTGALSISFADPAQAFPSSGRVAFKEGALTFNCSSNGGGNLASPTPTDRNYGKSLEVTNVVSSSGVTTVSLNVGDAGSAAGVSHTYVESLTNGTILIYDPVATTTPIPKFEDWNILLYPSAPICANVEATIDTEFGILDGILEYAADPQSQTSIAPGETVKNTGTLWDNTEIITYPDNFIYDQNNQRMAIRGIYDDYPIIEASPYTQNSSVISFLGGSGALVDGSKVKQPNCPFPGLELDGTASYPNQGKSMVASAFTIVSFGGTGYKVVEDGYTQLVSVFVIFCEDGVLADTGGYCSITNSATNFGTFALRAIGFRREAYSFDVGTISNVSATPTGRTILRVSGLGREPLEHYICKFDGYKNTDPEIEFFVDAVSGVTVGPPFTADLTIDNGTGEPVNLTNLISGLEEGAPPVGATIRLHRPSIVNSSSHTWEFAGSGTNYLALPENGGTKIEAYEQVSELYGRVYVSGTDELGDFKVGTFAKIENRTGAITFTGTVTISEVEFLKLKGGDVVVTGFDASNTLGGANSSNSKIPTQKAVRDYITNNLGPYINKPYSTNAVPQALVQLTDSGKISVDQIPALRPFEVYTVADEDARLEIEGALAGDIAIEQDTSTSYILNNDLDSQYVSFNVDPTLSFTIGDIFTGSISGGRIQATEYRQGVVYSIQLTSGGTNYLQASPPTVTISGGNPTSGSVEAKAQATVANGEVVLIELVKFNGYVGGLNYTTQPIVTIDAPQGGGSQATANAFIESRLYGNIVNRIKIEDTDQFESSDVPSVDINVNRAVNTSSFNNANWVSLSSNVVDGVSITGGPISTDVLAQTGAANSYTFLRGDSSWALAVQSIKGAETRYFAQLISQVNTGSSELLFNTLADALIGHEVLNNIVGIQPNTNITGVLTVDGETTVSINNPVTATIPSGTILEFERGSSPMIFESTFTQGNFVDSVILSNGGTGFTNGQYFDVDLVGGTGNGLKCNLVVANGSITEITITSSGSGYDGDFTISTPPTEIGAGSGLVLLAKVSTVNRQYANVAVDIQRVSDQTISTDLFGTIGVARFKKSQFNIGVSGNGSVELNVGADSGLDADLLDGQQGSYYLNATNISSGRLNEDRLSGTYNISIANQSGNTLRLASGTNNPTSSPTPDNFVGGVVANTINNSANLLNDGGTKNMVLTFRAGGTSFDTSFGGVRQLAFTDNDNLYIRGSGTGVTSFGSWGKIWSALNDGIDSGLDADKLDNKQGSWYQNALNINYGTISDNRLPDFIDDTAFQDQIEIRYFPGDRRYKIYVSGLVLASSPFVPGEAVNLYNAQGQGTGTIEIDNIIVNNDTVDNSNDYTIIIGRLTTGDFVGALTIGSATDRKEFQDFTIDEGNTINVATLESDGGTGNLRLGRKDGQASSPGIYFNSSALAATYNVALVAQGGNATAGSGTLNAQVQTVDGFSINGNKIWNAGNIQFQTLNVAETAVLRGENGEFSCGTITLDTANGAVINGAANLNVLKGGDTMTGNLTISGTATLSVGGTANLLADATVGTDFTVNTNTFFVDASNDSVAIGAAAAPSGVKLTITDNAAQDVIVDIYSQNDGNDARLRLLGQDGNATTEGFELHYDNSVGDIYFNQLYNGLTTAVAMHFSTKNFSDALTITGNGKVGVNMTPNDAYELDVTGDTRIKDSLTIGHKDDNGGAPLYFLGSSGFRNFEVGNNLLDDNVFAIRASASAGGVDWNPTIPALALTVDVVQVDDGEGNLSNVDVHRMAVNTNAFQGVDPEDSTIRLYVANINGDLNVNGQLFQNNAPFVTSRWTESPNGDDIYRASRVGIGFTTDKDPGYALDVEGDFNVTGATYIGGVKQYQDSQGIIRAYNTEIEYDVNIDANSKNVSTGPITVKQGVNIVFGDNSSWTIL